MITPLDDNVLLRVITKQLGMSGGLHIPEMSRLSGKTSCQCEVVAVGRNALELKVGNKVHLSVYDKKAAGTEIEHEGEKLILIKERDVNGLLN